MRLLRSLLIIALLWIAPQAHAGGYRYHLPSPNRAPETWETLVGITQGHTVAPQETLLDIARKFSLGYNEMEILYPQVDPWLPRVGSRLLVPTQWVLPPSGKEGIVINIPEMRLYYFHRRIQMVSTYPIGIGDMDWETPIGTYKVIDRRIDPTWTIPLSLREKYGVSFMPPGPDNPLGSRWLGLSRKGYGIHGTDFAWSVGRLVTHGCIRLYPEHMEELYPQVPAHTPVELIYEPVKVGFRQGEIFLEVHTDPYRKIGDLEEHARKRLQQLGLWGFVSQSMVINAVRECNGVPVRIGTLDRSKTKTLSLAQLWSNPVRR